MPLAARAQRWAPAIAGVAAIAGLAAIAEPNAYPSYDYAFAMASAQDALAGRANGYEVPVFSPVPHPLTIAEALLSVPFGNFAFTLFTVVALLALGLLCWAVFRIGCAIASWPVGALAAVLVFTSPPIFELGVRSYGDVVFAALVAAALALELGTPRRGWPVLAVLALAGLLRPEAWLLSGLYWLYLVPPLPWIDRARMAAVVAAAPVGWMASDLFLTGDPLRSVEITRTYTDKAGASASFDELSTAVRSLMGWPVLLGAPVGAVLAWRHERRAALATLATGGVLFAATVAPAVIGESPVLRRYLVVPGVVIALLFGVAVLGWTTSAAGSRGWRLAGSAALVLAVAVLAVQRVDKWDGHRHAQAHRVDLLEHVRDFATAPRARAYLVEPACRPVLTPGYAYRPYLRFWLDVPPRAVAFAFRDPAPADGAVLLPTAKDRYQRLMLAEVGRRTRANVLARDGFTSRFRLVANSARWELYAGARCRRAVDGRIRANAAGGLSRVQGTRS